MKSKKKTRAYNSVARADSAAQTTQDILKAAADIIRTLPINEITLEEIALRANVTVRTVLRKFGSKEGVYEGVQKHDALGMQSARNQVAVGDVEQAISVLLSDYEVNGDLAIRVLAVEADYDVFHRILTFAREWHRDWCARIFAPYMPKPSNPDYETRLLSFIAATEMYLWKLLRRDLKKSIEETHETFRLLIYGLIKQYGNN